jgi:methylase of polypeptide subunit release factors
MTPGAFAGERVLADARALEALARLGAVLRAAGYDNKVIGAGSSQQRTASQVALGYSVATTEMDSRDVDALARSGAVDLDHEGERLEPRFMLFALGEVLVLVPKDGGEDPGRVYFGRDSLWLADMAARLTRPGGALADLGTGAGTVAAALASRFDSVVATEILPRTAACAAVTFALNPRPSGAPAATVGLCDVAAGLAPGAFSLVTANPPWVPDLDREHSPARVYAEGGSTGFELPRRFIVEGANLLAPDGVMLMMALDATWDSGERPLRSLARGLVRLGFEVHMEPTGISEFWKGTEDRLCARFPGMRSAEHVALVVHRPATGLPRRAALLGQLGASGPERTNLNSGPKTRWVASSV